MTRRGAAVRRAIVVRAALAAFAVGAPAGRAAADAPAATAAEAPPRCHPDEDLACAVVRETPAGVWVWTERFEDPGPASPAWSLAIGGVPVSPPPAGWLVAGGAATPNGAPILQ